MEHTDPPVGDFTHRHLVPPDRQAADATQFAWPRSGAPDGADRPILGVEHDDARIPVFEHQQTVTGDREVDGQGEPPAVVLRGNHVLERNG